MAELVRIGAKAGVKPSEFWTMTHGEFQAVMDGYHHRERVEDIRTARIQAVIAEVNRNSKKRTRPYTPADFLPHEQRKQSNEEIYNVLRAFTNSFGR